MGYISSINFKKSKDFQVFHNADIRPSYAIGGKLECNRNSNESQQEKQRIIDEAKEAYTAHTGQKFQAKSYEWSAVCNIKDSTTMQELEKLTEHFLKKYGFQCYQIAIHRDEGHINEQGEKIINHHAHLEFITLDKETGKNNYRRELITPSVLRQIQDEVAEILQMERGQDKRLSGAKRIEPRKYAQMKEAEKRERKELTQELSQEKTKNMELQAELTSAKFEILETEQVLESTQAKLTKSELSQKAIKERLEQERKAWIAEQTHTAEEYKKLRALKEQQYQTIQELESQIQNLNEELQKEKSKLSDLSAKNQKNDDLPSEINKNDFRAISDHLNDNFQKLQKENEELQKENAILKACFKAFSVFLKGERWQTPLKRAFSLIKNIDNHDKNLFNELSQDLKTSEQEQQAKKLEAFRKMQGKELGR